MKIFKKWKKKFNFSLFLVINFFFLIKYLVIFLNLFCVVILVFSKQTIFFIKLIKVLPKKEKRQTIMCKSQIILEQLCEAFHYINAFLFARFSLWIAVFYHRVRRVQESGSMGQAGQALVCKSPSFRPASESRVC